MEFNVLARFRRLVFVGLLCIAAGACGVSGVPDSGWAAEEDQLQSAIASSTGYPAGNIEVLVNPAQVNVSISNPALARADRSTRERVANAVVAAVQLSMSTNTRLAAVVEIRLAIVHPEMAHGLLSSTHTEDVLDFKKGASQQFYWDVL